MTRYTDSPAEQVEYQVTAAPTEQIITVADLRHHLRVQSYGGDADVAEDAYLESLIAAAGGAIETEVRRPVRAQTRDLILPAFPYRSGYDAAYGAYGGAYGAYGGAYGGYGTYWWGYWNADGAIVLDITPIRAVTAITYTDDGAQATVPAGDYTVFGAGEGISRRVRIALNEGKSWPTRIDSDSDVVISVDCGWQAANMPAEFKHAARIICAGWYRFREEVVMGAVGKVPKSAAYLLNQFKRFV